METFWNVFSVILAVAALALFVYVIVKSAFDWSKKGAIPVVNMHARVCSKRCDDAAGGKKSGSNSCFAVFENDSGELKELCVTRKEFSQLAEGDGGTLTYRGDVLLSFEISTREEAVEDENAEKAQ